MGKCDEFSGHGGANSRHGMVTDWRGNSGLGGIKVPQAGVSGPRAVKNGLVLVSYVDVGGSEGNIASGITKLANGKECVGCKLGDNVDLASIGRKVGQVQVSNMCRVHDAAIGVADGEWVGIGTFVENREINGSEVCSTACIGNEGTR
jgi:hypothetical protein